MVSSTRRGISLHIGLNQVDPGHYQGWNGRLNACEFDAQDMQALARQNGFETSLLLTEQATRANILAEIGAAAQKLEKGDIFLLTFSGHGGQIPKGAYAPPANAYDSEATDEQDETWCLYDAQLLDDELNYLYRQFQTGVRILLVQDCCHSGFSTFDSEAILSRYAGEEGDGEQSEVAEILKKQRRLREAVEQEDEVADGASPEPAAALARAMPRAAIDRTYEMNREFYERIRAAIPRPTNEAGVYETSPASILAFSACRERELALDGAFNGAFTAALKRVWGEGNFSGDYFDLYEKLVAQMRTAPPPRQTPEMYSCAVDPVWISWIKSADIVAWASQTPFAI